MQRSSKIGEKQKKDDFFSFSLFLFFSSLSLSFFSLSAWTKQKLHSKQKLFRFTKTRKEEDKRRKDDKDEDELKKKKKRARRKKKKKISTTTSQNQHHKKKKK